MINTTREDLLRAATHLMLERGYHGTTVDEICSRAGMTKGAFFHHFESKDELGLATLDRYADRIFAVMKAGAGESADPKARVLAYIEASSRIGYASDKKPACLLAIDTMELGAVNDQFRRRCEEHFETWARYLETLLTDAMPDMNGEARSWADHFISVFEGSVLLARAKSDPAIIERNLRAYAANLRLALNGRSRA